MSIFGHGKQCYCQACIQRNSDAVMYPATRGPWNMEADASIRSIRLVDHARLGNSSREDLSLLFELDQEVGHEGTDYQNPYDIPPTATLVYPAPYGTALDPSYALGLALDNADSVAINIQATAAIINRGY